MNTVLQRALDERASDIHWEPLEDALRVRFRVDGMLREVMTPPKALHAAVVSRLKIMAQLDISERRLPQDGRFGIRHGDRDIDLRVSTLPTVFGEKVAIRLLDRSQGRLSLEQVGFGPAALTTYRSLIRRPYGLVLVTGPTGSGKTTTLVATLSELNSPEKNIITVEDPVEYHIPGVNQVQVNPKAGLDFANGLRV
ncbi:MAG: Flp pilus assembly complex ATPase component TadA, partial [Firmicutes bacterium]|nr:Flp pilus assembly complex ATPase component TadA [Bacillota bacterium]